MPACGPSQVGNCENHYNQPLWEEEWEDSKSSEGHSAKKDIKKLNQNKRKLKNIEICIRF